MQKDPSKLATLASAQQPSPPQPQQLVHPYHQQQRPASPPSPTPPSTQQQQRATLLPRSVSNTQRPLKDESGASNNNNAPVRRRSSVQIDNDSNISNNSSIRRRSSMMLDSDISAESRRSNASSCHRHHRSQQQNEPYQPVWLRRQTQCAACNPNPVRKSLSRSSSMYDVAGVAQQQHPRAIHTGAQQHPNTHATITTTATSSSSSSQNNTTPPTAAATAAAAMAAAAAVVSAAAATATCGISTTTPTALDEQWGLTQSNDDKWMRLISSCMAQSGRLERLARDMVTTEKQAASMIDSQQSMEQLMKRRDDQHHNNIRHCESLVRAQREMLNEMESLLTEYGIKKNNQQQKQPSSSPTSDQHEQQRQAMTTPPPSSPSDYSSSLPSMPPSPSSSNHNNENEENATTSEDVNTKEQEQAPSSSSSPQDDKEQETADSIQEQYDDQSSSSSSSDKDQQKTLGDFVEDSVSRIRWTVSQWVGGSVGTGQLVKCEMGPDGQTSTIIVAGTGVTTEPKLLPKVMLYPKLSSTSKRLISILLFLALDLPRHGNQACILSSIHSLY